MKLENTLFTLGALGSISAALVIPNLENAADHHELINKEDHHERPRKVEFTKDDDEEPSDSEDKEHGKFHKKGRKGQDKESPEFNGKRASGSHGSAHEGGKGMKPKHESSNDDDNDDKKKKPHHKGGCHENKVEEKKVKGKKVKGKKHHEKTLEKGRHHNRLAPLVSTAQFNPDAISKIIPNRYIIVFKRGAPQEEIDFHKENVQQAQLQSVENLSAEDAFFISTKDTSLSTSEAGGIQDSFNIDNLFSGYIGYFTQEIVDLIRQNPLVDFVERDSIVEATEFDTQNSAPWGLARISHRERLNLGSFNKYLYDDDAGRGVTSYVIDTGVNINHKDFEKRAIWGKTIPLNDEDLDGNGHGTHCAGTIASKHYGVAKNANVVAVKVLRSNGSGTMSDVVKGVEYAAKAHQKEAQEKKKGFKGSTANMSLGGGKSPALDLAVNAAVEAGIHFAVAAGNENQDACNTSPASADKAITVGASTLSDDRAYFSNWGKCVDVFAPGLNILSTYIGSDDATATLSGTSMASPHVAGLLTYFLSLQPGSDSEFFELGQDSLTPQQLKKKLIHYSTKDILFDIPEDTPNVLIYNGGGQDLSAFWNDTKKSHSSGFKQELNMDEFIGSKTDLIFDQVRDILDKLNII
ncbi:CLL_collapsed_G0013410.mRNA.1.CDS.1 [Saccharomyces cerevisiae]|uniref:K7_Prb1p n=1 Tax=Saccharomyces cerevisiae (strain Kyokai no. 7 / NBRC 101557) TaxID=721032 RepID=G2WCH4_YEASK|nr:CLN_G0014030.mRNA.1.CDS.1 [Saccharomyces cerevisiae]GAA22767.1 K7_Prb1p [Saccharomyces cerevisiae Kyokai no. 7]CAI5273241.1 CLL_HP2_G0012340.mRNA.1.CDS.1 [Saccharomyces cerevisiae]CAI5278453.1 CIH_HP2_G0013390.mRNA.1.CDS.1 [Saccharomyces cerevisiae]CAI6464300.1 CLL_HP1_G0013160.mRNA.1.CDS.1 [Saccharomyces cerevisiae]